MFFDELGIKWEYEKEGYELPSGRYLPDFWLPRLDCFAEVKPQMFSMAEYTKCGQLPKPCILLDQPVQTARPYFTIGISDTWDVYRPGAKGPLGGWAVLSYSQYKGRLWFWFGEDYRLNYFYDEVKAENAAKSARFEFGENS